MPLRIGDDSVTPDSLPTSRRWRKISAVEHDVVKQLASAAASLADVGAPNFLRPNTYELPDDVLVPAIDKRIAETKDLV